jgi:hypothetical protein
MENAHENGVTGSMRRPRKIRAPDNVWHDVNEFRLREKRQSTAALQKLAHPPTRWNLAKRLGVRLSSAAFDLRVDRNVRLRLLASVIQSVRLALPEPPFLTGLTLERRFATFTAA